MKRYIVDKNLNVYDTKLFGTELTGKEYRISIIYKDKAYYIRTEYPNGAPVDGEDDVCDLKLDVIFEADSLEEVSKLKDKFAQSIATVTAHQVARAVFEWVRKLSFMPIIKPAEKDVAIITTIDSKAKE